MVRGFTWVAKMSNRLARIDALASTAGSDDVGDPCEPKNTKILKPELIV